MAVRDTRASYQQLEKLFQYMVEHSEFAHGRLVGQQGKKKASEMWESLSASLNALGSGPPKPAFKWQKCWTDWKNNVKKKAQKLRAHARGTDGGPPLHPLTVTEQRLFEWMTPEGVEGDPNVPEAGGFSELPLEIIFEPGVEMAVPVVLPATSRVTPNVTEGENWKQHSAEIPRRMECETEEMNPGRNLTEDVYNAIDYESELPFTPLRRATPKTMHKRKIGDFTDLVKVEEKRVMAEERKMVTKDKQLQQEDRRIALEDRRIALEERREVREDRRIALEERREVREDRRIALEKRREVREDRRIALEERREVREDRRIALEERREVREDRRIALEKRREVREDRRIALEERREVREDRRIALEERREVREDRRIALEERREVREDRRIALEERREVREDRRIALEERRDAREERRDAWLMTFAEQWMHLQQK